MIGGNFFRDGASPELQALMDEMDELERVFYLLPRERQQEFLQEHPRLRDLVTCCACGQTLPQRPEI